MSLASQLDDIYIQLEDIKELYAKTDTEIEIVDEVIDAVQSAINELRYTDNDGQPDEFQEWSSYDPDC